MLCAGLWLGPWRKNTLLSYSTLGGRAWGAPRADGDDDLSLDGSRVRLVGRGIEGRPDSQPGSSSGISLGSSSREAARAFSGWVSPKGKEPSSGSTLVGDVDAEGSGEDDGARGKVSAEQMRERRERQARTAAALLQTFSAHTGATLSTLADMLPPQGSPLVLTPRDILAFELGPLSELDARFVEWLVEEYGGGVGLTVKRGWRDLFGLLLGLG